MDYITNIDYDILYFIQEHMRVEWMDGFWKVVTSLGNGGLIWIAFSLFLLCSKKTRPAGITALAALAIGVIITNLALKNIVERVRPFDEYSSLIPLIQKPVDFSFPSGHTCASFAAGTAMFKYLPKKIGIPVLVLAGMIMLSRLYVGVHYPTDVLVGAVIGVSAGLISCYVYNKVLENRIEK